MKKTIIQNGDPRLREVSKEIPPEEIKGKAVQSLIRNLRDSLRDEDDGVAIAAPQIGELRRIFIAMEGVGKRDFEMPPRKERKYKAYINPVIIKRSKETQIMEEGCLSIRWWYGNVERSQKVRIRAYDEEGNLFEIGASGIVAQMFQHEIDHLDGILFIDKATDLKEIPPEQQGI